MPAETGGGANGGDVDDAGNAAGVGEDDVKYTDMTKDLSPLELMLDKAETCEFMLSMLQKLKVKMGFRSV